MKNKYILLWALLALLCPCLLQAQIVSYGVLAGPSSRNISYGSYNIFNHPNIGADFGVLTELRYSEHFSLQPMVEFSAQGSKSGSFISPFNYDPDKYSNDVKFGELNYLMVPVLAKFGWNFDYQSHYRFFVSAGPYAAFLLSANQVLISPDQQKISGSSMNVKPALNTFNAGLDGNIGVSYYFPYSSIFIQAGGNYGLVKIQKDQSAGSNYAGAAALTVGYSFWIDNNFLNNGHFAPKK